MSTREQEEITVQQAENIMQREYEKDVRDVADSIRQGFDDVDQDYADDPEGAREWVSDRTHEECDGAARVIYTHRAILCLLYSRNDDAMSQELGCLDGVIQEGGSINWSVLAFFAFRADVIEELGDWYNEPLGEDPDA
jgi:hypothetical protein